MNRALAGTLKSEREAFQATQRFMGSRDVLTWHPFVKYLIVKDSLWLVRNATAENSQHSGSFLDNPCN